MAPPRAAVVAAAAAAAAALQPIPTTEVAPGVHLPMITLGGVNATLNPAYPDPSNYTLWLELGGRGFDTAWEYQTSGAIAAAVRASGVPRSQVFVTTKIPGSLHTPCTSGKCAGFPSPPPVSGSYTPEMARAFLADNLARLGAGIGYIDLLLIHEPCDYGGGAYSAAAAAECAAVYSVLEEALANGTARAIGVSNWRTPQLDALRESNNATPAVNQCRMAVGSYDKETHDYCKQHGITYQAYSPLHSGAMQSDQVAGIAAAHNVSGAQVMLRWVTQHGVPLVTASDRADYDVSDIAVFGFNLTDDEMGALDNFSSCTANKRCVNASASCLSGGCEVCGAGAGAPDCPSCGCTKCCDACQLAQYGGTSFCTAPKAAHP